jgi:hypothetical protein
VYRPSYGTKRYHHPLVGGLILGFEAFTPIGDLDQTLGLHTVEPSQLFFRAATVGTVRADKVLCTDMASECGSWSEQETLPAVQTTEGSPYRASRLTSLLKRKGNVCAAGTMPARRGACALA